MLSVAFFSLPGSVVGGGGEHIYIHINPHTHVLLNPEDVSVERLKVTALLTILKAHKWDRHCSPLDPPNPHTCPAQRSIAQMLPRPPPKSCGCA